MENLALGYCFSLKELFHNFNIKRLKIKTKDSQKIAGDRRSLAKRIFSESVRLVMNDVIDNNITFELPVGSKKAEIHMKRYTGDEFATARGNGKFQEIDFLKSYFTGYQPGLFFRSHYQPIYLNKELQQKIIDNTNNGKQYC